MIISPERRFIFVHIPKTGGTSMARALEARAHRDDILIGDTPKAVRRRARLKSLQARGRLWKHSTLADIDGVLSPDEIAGMFCFCLVRNPWDRMVSYYHWLLQQSFDHLAVTTAQTHDFGGFVAHAFTRHSIGAWPYGRYMQDVTGVEHCALFLRLERLDEDTGQLLKHLGFALDVPHDNRSDRGRDYREYYTQATRQIVAETCAEDIARFSYAF